MDNENSLKTLKALIDFGVQKGIFASADEVLSAINAYNHIAGVIVGMQNKEEEKK